jgi:tetratricopeptide (TPR) repeat protein/predicted Ser/Thr protein kinase
MTMHRTDAGKLSRFLSHPGLLGQLAVMNGFLNEADLVRCLDDQKKSPAPVPIGALLVSQKLITPEQLQKLLDQQKEIEERDRAGNPSLLPDGPDRKIGHYDLVSKLGEGGGGTVWKAWDTRLCRWVALKEPRGHHLVARERFVREARAAAKLKHPNLIEVYEITFDADQDFMVMEYIDGRPLDQLKLSARDGAVLIADIADAVDYMHASGVLHRDLKPQNIIVDAKGVGHLGDFGIAKVFGNAPLTMEGAPIGTPQYMAPEQVDGKAGSLGPGTDVYGLGATLYFLLVGRAPYAADTSLEALLNTLRSQDAPSPKSINADVPPELDVIVRRAMSRIPAERYSSAAGLRDDLRRWLRGESIVARPDGLARKTLKWARRNGRLVAAVALAALASATAVSFYTYRKHAALRGRQEAYEAATEKADRLWQRATGLIRAGHPSPDAFLGTLERTLAQYEAAAVASPGKPYPWLMKGRCLMLLGRRPDAEAAWTEALRLNSAYGPALFERGKSSLGVYMRLGLLRRPSGSRSGPEVEPPDPESDETKAWRKKGEQDLAAARETKDLDKPSLSYLEGMLELGGGRRDRAVDAFRVYVAEYPWDADAMTYLGAALYRQGKLEEARASWGRALELQPSASRHKLMGDVLYGLQNYPEAIDQYTRALALNPGDSAAQCNRGLAHHAGGNSAAALEDYNGALALHPRFARAFNCRGIAWFERRDFDRALEDFERAAECNEFYAEAHNNLGNTHVRRHEIEEGIKEYAIALEIHPNYADAHFNRGIAHLLKGDLDLAIRDFERACEIDLRDPESRYQLALAERAKGDAVKSIRDLSQAIELGSTSWSKRSQAQGTLKEWTGK